MQNTLSGLVSNRTVHVVGSHPQASLALVELRSSSCSTMIQRVHRQCVASQC